MATAKITKRVVDSLQEGETVWDFEVTGFGVRRQKGPARVYMLKHRNQHGRQGWITIGRHGSPWTPETARAEAKRLLRLIEAGEDPGEARDATKAALTVDMLCDRFLVDVEARRKESTADEYRGCCGGRSAPHSASSRSPRSRTRRRRHGTRARRHAR